MPILSAQGESDARVAAWLLATTAVDCLKAPESAPRAEVALNNVYRLLEAAKLNPFFGVERADVRTGGATNDPVLSNYSRERNLREVRQALDRAIVETFGEISRQDAIESVETVLRGLTYPAQFAEPSPEARTQVAKFFEAVLEQLKTA